MESQILPKFDFKKWINIAVPVFVIVVIVSALAGAAQFFFSESQIRGYYMKYEVGDYYVYAKVRHGLDFNVYKTTNSKEALDVLDRFNNVKRETLPYTPKFDIPDVPKWEVR